MRDHIIATMTWGESESCPSPKRHRIAPLQADASSSSSGCPQFHAPSSEFNPSLPFFDPPAASTNLPQSPGYIRSIPSSQFVNDVPLNLHTRTHQAIDESDNKSEDTLDGDAAEATDPTSPGTDGLWNGEDVDMEDKVDPHEGIVLDLDILVEEFLVEAEELGKSKYYLLHTP